VRDKTCFRRAIDRIDAHLAQPLLQPERRLRLFKRHLRVLVQMPAPVDQIRLDCAHFRVKHRLFSLYLSE